MLSRLSEKVRWCAVIGFLVAEALAWAYMSVSPSDNNDEIIGNALNSLLIITVASGIGGVVVGLLLGLILDKVSK